MFFLLSYYHSYTKKASGLGLYLCKNILDKLSHKISIESEVGVKTKVILDLSMIDINIE